MSIQHTRHNQLGGLRSVLWILLSPNEPLASEPRERSAPAKRRARERAGESEGPSPSDRYDAYLVANGELRALPAGASFDSSRGILYWQPGVGYTGAYEFVVVRDGRERVPVRVVLQPQRHAAPAHRGFDFRFATESADVSGHSAGLR
jgi:hypothetical protein